MKQETKQKILMGVAFLLIAIISVGIYFNIRSTPEEEVVEIEEDFLILDIFIPEDNYRTGEPFSGKYILEYRGDPFPGIILYSVYERERAIMHQKTSGIIKTGSFESELAPFTIELLPFSEAHGVKKDYFYSPGTYTYQMSLYNCNDLGLTEENCVSEISTDFLLKRSPVKKTSKTLSIIGESLIEEPEPEPELTKIEGVPEGFTFDNNLARGAYGEEVKYLQIVLNADPDTRVAAEGVGSPGNETMHFGFHTHQAVINFQEKYASEILEPEGLVSGTGFVWPGTREKLNHLLQEGIPVNHNTVTPSLNENKDVLHCEERKDEECHRELVQEFENNLKNCNVSQRGSFKIDWEYAIFGALREYKITALDNRDCIVRFSYITSKEPAAEMKGEEMICRYRENERNIDFVSSLERCEGSLYNMIEEFF